MEVKKNRLAQDINIDNNPVNKDIIPEENKDIKEEETTPTPVITEEEIKPIEQNNTIEETIEPDLEPIENVEDIPTTTTTEPVPVIERPRNTVRYIDGGFTF
jgi:hypothetical protein